MRKFILFVVMVLVLWCPLQAEQSSLTASVACPVTGSNTGCIVIGVSGAGTIGLQVTGTFVGTLTFETSVDTTTWVAWNVLPNGSATAVSTATAPGVWQGNVKGFVTVRVRFSAFTSGTAVVTLARSNT